ncbi:MAG: M50 family metallopeptidase, partial [Chloroflexota bacterium]|nr:M50 family metallopeptidase [Chloroflexota bacterium]
MDVIGTILAFLVVLVILVLVHEFGHFVVAKLAGITVQEFAVGYPPRLASVTWRGTRYSVNAIPLGGYVKMLGEDGEGEAEQMRKRGLSEAAIDHAMAGAFNRKPIWLRIVVLVAGVVMNFLLAVVLFAGYFSLPTPDRAGPLTVAAVQANSPAQGLLRDGDVIVGADGRQFGNAAGDFHYSTDLTKYVTSRAGQIVTLDVERNGSTIEIPVRPRVLTAADIEQGKGAVGFAWEATPVMRPPTASGPIDALGRGLSLSAEFAANIPGGLGRTVLGLIGLAPNTGDARGPIGIAQITGEVVQQPLASQLWFVGVLSVNLAVLNVLPFPPLDGGRVVVVLLEAVRRRRLPAEREALIYLTGFLVLITLVILIS